MSADKRKARVDFRFSMGSIPAMLRTIKPAISEKEYRKLCESVNSTDSYLEQKRMILNCAEQRFGGE